MRELLLILGAACIASLPFVAFSEWFQTVPRQDVAAQWSNDLSQTNPPYSMPKVIAASAKIGQR